MIPTNIPNMQNSCDELEHGHLLHGTHAQNLHGRLNLPEVLEITDTLDGVHSTLRDVVVLVVGIEPKLIGKTFVCRGGRDKLIEEVVVSFQRLLTHNSDLFKQITKNNSNH